ncbi:MAG: protoporphyrinogen oxidase [Thermoanaerobaculia bacterium]
MSTLVIGGGLSGLVHARALSKAGEDVVVVEKGSDPGGAVRTIEKNGYLLELGPNTVRPTARLLDLCRDLGLESEMVLSDPGLPRFVDRGGRLRRIPFPALGLAAAVRAGAELFVRAAPAAEEESAFDWVSRRFGSGMAERVFEPFVSGIFAGDARRLSMAAAFPKFSAAERDHGGVLRSLLQTRGTRPKARARGLLSFRRGLATLPGAIAASLGDHFHPGVSVESVAPGGSGWVAETSAGRISAGRLVIATSAGEAARICGPFAPAAAASLRDIPSPALCVAHCSWHASSFRRFPRGFGHLCTPSERRRILGAVWSSSVFSGRAPAGRVLMTFFLGGRRTPEWADVEVSQLPNLIAAEVREPLGVTDLPELVHREVYRSSIPQYEAGHLGRIAALEAAESLHSGLKFLGNYRGGVSVGDVVDNAAIISPP